MKKILKFVLALLGGCAIGAAVGGGAALLFTDVTLSEFLAKFAQIGSWRLLLLVAEAVVAAGVAAVLGIVVHEGGHLLFGLLTGYRFVSFRVFSLTLLKVDGRLRLKRFALSGTGGQCLMRPPQRPWADIDTRWYNAGGVLLNLITAAACLWLYVWSTDSPDGVSRLPEWLEIFLLISLIIHAAYALTNGIPMTAGGIGNDGYNLLHMERCPGDKRMLFLMLEANARVQTGTQPKDLPDEWFAADEHPNWADGLQANWQMMRVARLVNRLDWDAAYALLTDALAHRDEMMALIRKEMMAEMVFVCLATGRTDEARACWTDDVAAYARQFAPTQSSKQRVLYAVLLRLEPDPAQAQQMLDRLHANAHRYVLQGEVQMDLALMEWLRQSV